METIKEALLIEENGLRTTCFIVENLPKHFLYHKVKKLMPMEEYSDRLVPAFTLDEQGKKHPTGELVDELLPGIKLDGAGSGALIFEAGNNESVQRLKAIDEYITKNIADPALRTPRVPYAIQPGNPSSNPKPYSQIPRVRLVAPAAPSTASPVVAQDNPHPAYPSISPLAQKKARAPLSEEQKAVLRERMAKARAAKNAPAA